MNKSNEPTPQLFFDTINAYQRSAALQSAIEVGLFTSIGKGNVTAAAIAADCKIAPRGARILADYLSLSGFLAKAGGRYSLTPDSAAFLDKASKSYLGGAVEFLRSVHLRARFDDLTAAVRRGGAASGAGDDDVLAPDHDAWVRFARGMASIMYTPAQELAKLVLASNPNGEIRVLDVAAGHGMFGIAVATQNPHARVVFTDWGNVLAVARENAKAAGVLDRCEFRPGSAFDVDLGHDYDAVLLTNILHHFDAPTNTGLLRRVHAALKPGGRALAVEFVPNDDRLAPPPSAAFALTLLATTPAGDAYTFAEYQPMFRDAGFTRVECANLANTMEQVVTAYR